MSYEREMPPGMALEENGTEVIPVPTLVDVFVPKEFPATVDLWRVVIQVPEPPTHSAGGIEIPDEYRERQEFATYIGMVRDMGPHCFKSQTRGKIDLAQSNKCEVGDWVIFGKHAGEKFRLRDGTLFVVLSDTEIIGVAERPEEFDCMKL